jgi:hypothetical protein
MQPIYVELCSFRCTAITFQDMSVDYCDISGENLMLSLHQHVLAWPSSSSSSSLPWSFTSWSDNLAYSHIRRLCRPHRYNTDICYM